MEKNDFKNMSNNELGIELKNLENEYEAIKAQVIKLINRMKELDKLFIEGNNELANRKKGIF